MSLRRSTSISSAVAAALLAASIAGCHIPPPGAPPSASRVMKDRSLMSAHGPVQPKGYGHISRPATYGFQAPRWYPWPTDSGGYQEHSGRNGAAQGPAATATQGGPPPLPEPPAPEPLEPEVLPLPEGGALPGALGDGGGMTLPEEPAAPLDDNIFPPLEPVLEQPAEQPLQPAVEPPLVPAEGDALPAPDASPLESPPEVDPFSSRGPAPQRQIAPVSPGAIFAVERTTRTTAVPTAFEARTDAAAPVAQRLNEQR
jgi:hypothetical protein